MTSGQSQVPRKGENSTPLRPSCFTWKSTHDEGEKTCFIHISYNTHHWNIPNTTISKYILIVRLFRAICIISVGLGGEIFQFRCSSPSHKPRATQGADYSGLSITIWPERCTAVPNQIYRYPGNYCSDKTNPNLWFTCINQLDSKT